MKIIEEFKAFAMRGNVMDLAVGVIIGAAFGKIVSALVESIIMPLIGIILGGIDLTDLSVTLGSATIKYGVFISAVIDFLIIAFVLFLMIRLMNRALRFGKKEEQKPAAPEVESKEVLILREIRDLLKK